MSRAKDPIAFAGSTLGRYRHVCAFFASPQDEYRTLMPFIRDGLAHGERAYHALNHLNDVLPRYDDPVICTYDANLMTASIAFDTLRTHPVAIVGGQLHENPYFARPNDILRELGSRRREPSQPYRGTA